MSVEAASIVWHLRRAAPDSVASAVRWPERALAPDPGDATDRLATRDLAALLEEIERAGGAFVPARAGVEAGVRPASALPMLLRASADVGSLLDDAVLYWRLLSSSRLERRALADGVELVVVDSWRDRRPGHDLLASYLVGLLVGALRNAGVTPVEIRLPGQAVPTNGASHAVFGASATSGADFARLRIDGADLGRPLEHADGLVAAYLRASLGRDLERLQMAVSWRVDELIRADLREPLGMRQVAKRLGLSERTLRRRLDDEGTSFRQRLDHVRRARALELLAREDVAKVARSLGFVDARSFQRAFRRWTGLTPLEYKRRSAAPRAPRPPSPPRAAL